MKRAGRLIAPARSIRGADEDDEREAGRVGLGRTLALSDGIFAIAMTLVAFQIKPPNLQGKAVHHLAHALGQMGADYYVFGLTFFVIRGLLARPPPAVPAAEPGRRPPDVDQPRVLGDDRPPALPFRGARALRR